MPGIADLDVAGFQERINGFALKYVDDWSCWLNTRLDARPRQFGIVMRRWQACRPNTMRRTRAEAIHDSPYLDDLLNLATQHINVLCGFNIANVSSFSNANCESLTQLWNIFINLSYRGRAREGLSGVVGISKAVLLLTDGRVGPAFDSEVRRNLGLENIANSCEWIRALRLVSEDIRKFEIKNNDTNIIDVVPPNYTTLQIGRIYDMALGPRE